MSQRYNRYERAQPGSFQALQTEAWLKHSARFRPQLVQLQNSMRKELDTIKVKNKPVSTKLLGKLTKQILDYIMFSSSSFLEYLCEYEAAYLCEVFEKHDVRTTDKAFKMYTDLLKSQVKKRTEKVQRKPRKKKKKTRTKKK